MSHGGNRVGAGRPKGLNLYGEATKPLRVPLSKIEAVKQLIQHDAPVLPPLYSCSVRAGFPSPADDYIEGHLDLNTHLIKRPAATFFVTAVGDSMVNAGIHSGDLLVVDRSIEATHDRIVIAAVNGELTVKRLSRVNNRVQLVPENPNYPIIDITAEHDIVIWGVVTYVIHQAS